MRFISGFKGLKGVKHSESFSNRMCAEAKIQAKFAIQKRLAFVCSEIIYAQTLLTYGRCVLKLSKHL